MGSTTSKFDQAYHEYTHPNEPYNAQLQPRPSNPSFPPPSYEDTTASKQRRHNHLRTAVNTIMGDTSPEFIEAYHNYTHPQGPSNMQAQSDSTRSNVPPPSYEDTVRLGERQHQHTPVATTGGAEGAISAMGAISAVTAVSATSPPPGP